MASGRATWGTAGGGDAWGTRLLEPPAVPARGHALPGAPRSKGWGWTRTAGRDDGTVGRRLDEHGHTSLQAEPSEHDPGNRNLALPAELDEFHGSTLPEIRHAGFLVLPESGRTSEPALAYLVLPQPLAQVHDLLRRHALVLGQGDVPLLLAPLHDALELGQDPRALQGLPVGVVVEPGQAGPLVLLRRGRRVRRM